MIPPEYAPFFIIAVVSLVLLIGAAWFGVKNYRLTRSVSNYWLIFAFLTASFTIVWVLILLQFFGVYAETIGQIRESMIMTWVAFLLVLTIEVLSSHDDVPIK